MTGERPPVLLVCIVFLACVQANATLFAEPIPAAIGDEVVPGSDWPWQCICGLMLGSGVGLYGGCLFFAILGHWESAAGTVKAFRSTLAVLLPTGGGTMSWWLGGKDGTALYVLGLGIGLVIAYVWPRGQSPLTFKDVVLALLLGDELRDKVEDVHSRARLVLNSLRRPETIARQEGISVNEYAHDLEDAVDAAENASDQGQNTASTDAGEQ